LFLFIFKCLSSILCTHRKFSQAISDMWMEKVFSVSETVSVSDYMIALWRDWTWIYC